VARIRRPVADHVGIGGRDARVLVAVVVVEESDRADRVREGRHGVRLVVDGEIPTLILVEGGNVEHFGREARISGNLEGVERDLASLDEELAAVPDVVRERFPVRRNAYRVVVVARRREDEVVLTSMEHRRAGHSAAK